jgi:hypothetical protein
MAVIDDLHDSLDLVEDAIGLVRKALNHNPPDGERRDLEQILLRLEAERGVLQAEFDAAAEGTTEVQGPTAAQMKAVAAFAAKVDAATKRANLSSDAIALGGKIFDLATAIVKHS